MGLGDLHSNRLHWGILRNSNGRELLREVIARTCWGAVSLPGCQEGVWVGGNKIRPG